MKKKLLIAALFAATGIVSSCTKENNVAPSNITKTLATENTEDGDDTEIGGGQLGTGDGGVDRPPVKRP
jgi:hypothetical protein